MSVKTVKKRLFYGDSVCLVASSDGKTAILEIYETFGQMPRRFRLKQTDDYEALAKKQEKYLALEMGLIPELAIRTRKAGGIAAPVPDDSNPTIAGGVREFCCALAASGTGTKHIKNCCAAGKHIDEWFKKNAPEVVRWSDIKAKHYLLFVQAHSRLTSGGFANYRKVITGVSKMLRQKHEIPNVWSESQIEFRGKRSAPKGAVLNIEELKTYFENADRSNPLFPVSVLTALTGLRVTEAVNVRTCDVNLTTGILTVEDTSTHRVKTENAARVLPICKVLCDFLAPFLKPDKPNEPLFLSASGQIFSIESDALRLCTRRYMKKLREKKIVPPAFSFREFRACFASICVCECGVLESDLKPYVGHSAGTGVTERYVRNSNYSAAILRERVISKLEVPFQVFQETLNKRPVISKSSKTAEIA